MHKPHILIVYPDPAGLALLTSMLKSLGHLIEEATNDRAAVRLMKRNHIDLVLAGVDPLDAKALELLTYVRRKHREVPVILLFPRLHPDRAKEALRLGAMAVLKYPVPVADLRAAVLQALERCEARSSEPSLLNATPPQTPSEPKPTQWLASSEHTLVAGPCPASANGLNSTVTAVIENAGVAASRDRIDQFARDIGLIGQDPSWRQVLDLAATIALTRTSMLIVGEPGTGKSLLARLIHSLGPHPERPFITVEGTAMADALPMHESESESEDTTLSASPNTSRDWSNKLIQAQCSTLYLDELAALPLELQIHLLRELQFRDYEATAGHPTPPSEVRFLISTSENLPDLIDLGRLRQELYHRVSVVSLMLPPLRHRGSDVELLAEWFRTKYAQEFHKTVVGFTHDALEVLRRHDWPGNVRELEAAIQRAVALCIGPRITSSHLAPILHHSHRQGRPANEGTPRPQLQIGVRTLKEALEEPEKRIIVQTLETFHWNRQETARVLGINRATLYQKMKKYKLLTDEPMCGH